jgi:hypothetical protein
VYRFVEKGEGDEKRVFYLDLKHGACFCLVTLFDLLMYFQGRAT